ncbi:hypothetical protein BH11VER1_BH11VER1_03710 [soil metagenome]
MRTRKLNSFHDLGQLTEEQRHEYHREFTAKFHELLDAGYGACYLATPSLAELLTRKILHGHGTEHHVDAWVIMPNHLHAIAEPAPDVTLGRILQYWKGGSARVINLAIERTGPLWQVESFDHIVRSEAQLQHFQRHIMMNPE